MNANHGFNYGFFFSMVIGEIVPNICGIQCVRYLDRLVGKKGRDKPWAVCCGRCIVLPRINLGRSHTTIYVRFKLNIDYHNKVIYILKSKYYN